MSHNRLSAYRSFLTHANPKGTARLYCSSQSPFGLPVISDRRYRRCLIYLPKSHNRLSAYRSFLTCFISGSISEQSSVTIAFRLTGHFWLWIWAEQRTRNNEAVTIAFRLTGHFWPYRAKPGLNTVEKVSQSPFGLPVISDKILQRYRIIKN